MLLPVFCVSDRLLLSLRSNDDDDDGSIAAAVVISTSKNACR